MSRGLISYPVRLVYWLICIAVILGLAGCAPKIPEMMTDDELQQCVDTASAIQQNIFFAATPYDLKYKPWMVTPPLAEISSPFTGEVLPYGQAVKVAFSQPAPDPNVDFRRMGVYVSPTSTIQFTEVKHPLYSLSGMAKATIPDFVYSWVPGSSGNFIVMVIFWNMRNGGNPKGIPSLDYGPPSMAYACVKVKPPQAGAVQPVVPVEVIPLDVITGPTVTATLIPSNTATVPPTFTPTLTPTFTPTFTATFKLMLPTFTKTFTPTTVPQVNCSSYQTKDDCDAHYDVCEWYQPSPVASGTCINKP